ncbi:hypothetical protein V8E55_010088 [Tylopilus felleus]
MPDDNDLTRLHITSRGFILLKPNYEERVVATTFRGENEFWSSQNLYRHLQLLESLVPQGTKASARVWIHAFFFRASAMLPPDKPTTLSPSSLSTLSGFVDYTAVVASQRVARTSLSFCQTMLFHASDHVPQAVREMYACGKILQKKVLRGALTNGYDWIFLLIKINDDYNGASYQESAVLSLRTTGRFHREPKIERPWPDLIAAILSYWIENSTVDLGSDDWFERL